MMKFLYRLVRCFNNIFINEAPGLSKELRKFEISFETSIEPNEPLARFITDKKNIRATGEVKPNAFSPHPQRRDLSVYRTKEISEHEIWHLSDRFCTATRPEKPAIARAEIPVELPHIHRLQLVADGEPHPRHINIEGWPTEPSAILMIKTEMANMAMTSNRDI